MTFHLQEVSSLFFFDLPFFLLIVPKLFADDVAFLISGKSFQSMQMQANSELAKLLNWIIAKKLNY